MNELKGAALVWIGAYLLLLNFTLLLKFILLNGNIELSKNVGVSKDETLENQSFSIRVLDTDLRGNSLGLEREKAKHKTYWNLLACLPR